MVKRLDGKASLESENSIQFFTVIIIDPLIVRWMACVSQVEFSLTGVKAKQVEVVWTTREKVT